MTKMLIIKQIARDIACNIREAEDKIGTAYSIRSDHPDEAEWYRDMAAEHLRFNDRAHSLIADLIDRYKHSDAHVEHPEYSAGMMAVWQEQHADLVKDSARVKAMVDSF